MYEMKGALSGRAAPGSASCPASPARRTARRCRTPTRITGFPPIPMSLGCPWVVPVSNGKSISIATAMVAQESPGAHFWFFLCPHIVHRMPTIIRTSRRLSTGLRTTCPQIRPQVTGCSSENTKPGGPPARPGPRLSWYLSGAGNTIARSDPAAYSGYMTTWRTLKRAGCMTRSPGACSVLACSVLS